MTFTLEGSEGMSDFIAGSAFGGLKFGEFDHLAAIDKTKLVRLMARIAEKSYRRGFQHGTLGRHTTEIQVPYASR